MASPGVTTSSTFVIAARGLNGATQAGSRGDVSLRKAAKLARVSTASVSLAGGVLAGLLANEVDAAILSLPPSYQAFLSGDLREVADLETKLPPSSPEGICASLDFIIMKINPTGEMHADWKKTSLDLPALGANAALANRVFSTAFVPIRKR